MFRKIYILSFVLTFFISTTGLPLTLHICKMMEMENIAECSMCESSKTETQIPCCSEEMEDEINVITDFTDPCCELTIIDKKLSDKFFFSAHSSKEEFILVSILVADIYDNQNIFSISISNSLISESPPGLLTNHLYLNHSVLLI
jgi:hypothetical protein